MPQQSVEILIKALDQFSPTFDKAGRDLDTMKTKLKSLDEKFGEGSNFAKIQKILMGGGAAAGLSMAGRILDDLTSKALEFRDALEAGEKTAGEMADELARSLPVLGGIWSAGRNIRELITGEQAELLRVKSIQESIQKTNELQVNQWRDIKAAVGDVTEEAAKLHRKLAEALAPPEARGFVGASLRFKEEQDAADKRRQKEIDEAKKRLMFEGGEGKGKKDAPAAGTIDDLIQQEKAQRDIVDEITYNEDGTAKRQISKADKDKRDIAQSYADRFKREREEMEAAMKATEAQIDAKYAEEKKARAAALGMDIAEYEKKMREDRQKQHEAAQAELGKLDDERAEANRAAMMSAADDNQRALMQIEDDFKAAMDNIAKDRKRLDEMLEQELITGKEKADREAGLVERERLAKEQAERAKKSAEDEAAAKRQEQLDAEIAKQKDLAELERERMLEMKRMIAEYRGFERDDGFGGGLAANIEQMNKLAKATVKPISQAAPPIPTPPPTTTTTTPSTTQPAAANRPMMSERQGDKLIETMESVLRELRNATPL